MALMQLLGISAWLVDVLGKSCDFYIIGIVFKTFSIIGLWLFLLMMGMPFFLRAEIAWQKAKKRGCAAINGQFDAQPYIAYVLTQEFKKRFLMRRLAYCMYAVFTVLLLAWIFLSTVGDSGIKSFNQLNQLFIQQCATE